MLYFSYIFNFKNVGNLMIRKGKGLGRGRLNPEMQNDDSKDNRRPCDGRGQGSGPGLRRGPQNQTGPRAQNETCIKNK